MRVWKKLLLAVSIPLATLVLVVAPLTAQEEREGLGISPTRISPSADPGETITGKFTVLNESTATQRFKVYANDFRVVNEEYDKDFEPVPEADSLLKWLTLPEGEHEMAAGEKREMEYSLTVPEGTVPRGYYGVIFAETVAGEADATGVVRIKRVGALLYLTVNGGSVEKGEFLGVKTPWWQRRSEIDSSLRVENTGNVHFTVSGQSRLKSVFGRTVSTANIEGTTLPATIRKFRPDLKVQYPIGIYKIEGEVKFLGETMSLGSRWVFVASPFWLVIVLLVIIAWVVSIRLWLKKKRVQRKKR